MTDPHWTENAERVSGPKSLANPLWGLIGESPDGDLLLPAWSQRGHDEYDGWWNRQLNLRRPTHWLPYLRSRLARSVAMLDD
jgi:hypothetical protein